MLGELYTPKGKAFETAKAVLEVENPMALNVAWGCANKCTYCYNRRLTRDLKMSFPKKPVVELVHGQLNDGLNPEGVFISFGTDPYLDENWRNTDEVVKLLRRNGIRVAVLSKLGVRSPFFVAVHEKKDVPQVRHGISIVSLSERFWRTYEPNTYPPKARLRMLRIHKNKFRDYTWVSIEPYPCPEIYDQCFHEILEAISFVDFAIFGRWNYDKRANTAEAKTFYLEKAEEFKDFCESNGIRYRVKSDVGG